MPLIKVMPTLKIKQLVAAAAAPCASTGAVKGTNALWHFDNCFGRLEQQRRGRWRDITLIRRRQSGRPRAAESPAGERSRVESDQFKQELWCYVTQRPFRQSGKEKKKEGNWEKYEHRLSSRREEVEILAKIRLVVNWNVFWFLANQSLYHIQRRRSDFLSKPEVQQWFNKKSFDSAVRQQQKLL